MRLRRALHFVPGGNEKMLAKALTLDADTLILDLEDAVTPERKESVRDVVAGWLADVDFGRQERTVRVNPLESPWGRADLTAVMRQPPDAIVLPKVRSLADIDAVDRILLDLEVQGGHPARGVRLILVATETAESVLNVAEMGRNPRVDALSWGAEDLSASLGARRTRDAAGEYLDVFRYTRATCLLAAVATGTQPVDAVFVDIRDEDALRRECEAGAAMGYLGKMTIHPSQVPIVNAAFTPTPDEIDEAQALIAAFAENMRNGRMAFQFRGQMVDAPHLARARVTVERARAAGVAGV